MLGFFFAFNQHVLPMFINRNCSVCIGFRCKWRCYHCTIWFWRESEKCPWVRGLRFFCYLTCLKQTGWQISNGSSPAGLQLATISHDIGMLLELRKYKSRSLNPDFRNFSWNSLLWPKWNSESIEVRGSFGIIKDRMSFQIWIFSVPFEIFLSPPT